MDVERELRFVKTYGSDPKTLLRKGIVTEEEAKRAYESFCKKYPKLAEFNEKLKEGK